MLVKHPASQKRTVPDYQEYQRIHHSYVRAYKKLHADVAAFSILPEKFIQEAEPVIEKYLHDYSRTINTHKQREQLQVITTFINHFHEFMDEATEMFNEHQSLSDETFAYLKRVIGVEAMAKINLDSKIEIDYKRLVPELEHLRTSLAAVKQNVNTTQRHLEALQPAWQEIKGRIS